MQKNIIFTRSEDNGLSVIVPEPKEVVLSKIMAMNKTDLVKFLLREIEKRKDDKTLFNWQSLAAFVEIHFKGIWEEEFEDDFFNKLVWAAVPPDSIKYREIEEADLPRDREFRNAWCDVTAESRIDIDLAKAKEIKLAQMREERQKKFEELGFPVRLNPELEAAIISQETRDKLQALRDATEPLKALVAEGYNDENILEQIRQLGKLN